jgi:hypothetical protein
MPGEAHRDDSGRDPCAVQPGGAELNDMRTERLFQCKLEGDKVPAQAIQTLVQVWKEMRGWYKRT